MEQDKSKRRMSILKPPKVQSDKEDAEEDTNVVRKVRFSCNFVKEFVPLADGDQHTLWDATYEEEIEKSSTSSIQSHYNTGSIHLSSGNITYEGNCANSEGPNVPPIQEDKMQLVPKNTNIFYPSFSNAEQNVDKNAKTSVPLTVIPAFVKEAASKRANKNAERKTEMDGQGDAVKEAIDVASVTSTKTKSAFELNETDFKSDFTRKTIFFNSTSNDCAMDMTNLADEASKVMTNEVFAKPSFKRRTILFNTTSNDCEMDITNIATEEVTKQNSMATTNKTTYNVEMNELEAVGGVIVQQDCQESKTINSPTINIQVDDVTVSECKINQSQYMGNKTRIFNSQDGDDIMEQTCASSYKMLNDEKSYADLEEAESKLLEALGSKFAPRRTIHFNEASSIANMDITTIMGTNETSEIQNKTRIFEPGMMDTSMEQTCVISLGQIAVNDVEIDEGKIDISSHKSNHMEAISSNTTYFNPTSPYAVLNTGEAHLFPDSKCNFVEIKNVPDLVPNVMTNKVTGKPSLKRKTILFNKTSNYCDMNLTNVTNEVDDDVFVEIGNKENSRPNVNLQLVGNHTQLSGIGNKTRIFDLTNGADIMEQTCVRSYENSNVEEIESNIFQTMGSKCASRKTIHFNEASPNSNMDITTLMDTNQTNEFQNKTRIFDPEILGTSMEQTCEFPLNLDIEKGNPNILPQTSVYTEAISSNTTSFAPTSQEGNLDMAHENKRNVVEHLSKIMTNEMIGKTSLQRKTMIFNTTSNNCDMDITNIVNNNAVKHDSLAVTNQTICNVEMNMTEVSGGVIICQDFKEKTINNRQTINFADDDMNVTEFLGNPKELADFVNKTRIFNQQVGGDLMEQTCVPNCDITNAENTHADLEGMGETVGKKYVQRRTIHFNTTSNNCDMDITNQSSYNDIMHMPEVGEGAIVQPDCKEIMSISRETINLHDDDMNVTECLDNQIPDVAYKAPTFHQELGRDITEQTCATSSGTLNAAKSHADREGEGANILQTMGSKYSSRKTIHFNETAPNANMEETCDFPLREIVDTGMPIASSEGDMNVKVAGGNMNISAQKSTSTEATTSYADFNMEETHVLPDIKYSFVGIGNVDDVSKVPTNELTGKQGQTRKTIHFHATLNNCDMDITQVANENVINENSNAITNQTTCNIEMNVTTVRDSLILNKDVDKKATKLEGKPNILPEGKNTLICNPHVGGGIMDQSSATNRDMVNAAKSHADLEAPPGSNMRHIEGSKNPPRRTSHCNNANLDITTILGNNPPNKTSIFDCEVLGTTMEETCMFPLSTVSVTDLPVAPSNRKFQCPDLDIDLLGKENLDMKQTTANSTRRIRRTINFDIQKSILDETGDKMPCEDANDEIATELPPFVVHIDSPLSYDKNPGLQEDNIKDSAKVQYPPQSAVKMVDTDRNALYSNKVLQHQICAPESQVKSEDNKKKDFVLGAACTPETVKKPANIAFGLTPVRSNQKECSTQTPQRSSSIPIRINSAQRKTEISAIDTPLTDDKSLRDNESLSSKNMVRMSKLSPEMINLVDTEYSLDELTMLATPQLSSQHKRGLPKSVSTEKHVTKRVDAKSTPLQLIETRSRRNAKRSIFPSPSIEALLLPKRIDDKQTPIKGAFPQGHDDSDVQLINETDDVLLPTNIKTLTSQTGNRKLPKDLITPRKVPDNCLKEVDVGLIMEINLEQFKIKPDRYRLESCSIVNEELMQKLQHAKEVDNRKVDLLIMNVRRFFDTTQLSLRNMADEIAQLEKPFDVQIQESTDLNTLEDKILHNAKSHSEYKLTTVKEDSVSLLVLLGKFRLTVRFQKQYGCVQSLDIEEPCEYEELKAFGKYVHSFFHHKIDPQCLESHIGPAFSILSLLDYLEYQITRFKDTLMAVCHSGILYRARLDCNQQLSYRFFTSKADVEVVLDLSEFNMEKVQVKPIIREGPARMRKILEIIRATPRDIKFPLTIIKAIHEHLGGLKTL